jgi:hypothetical protein
MNYVAECEITLSKKLEKIFEKGEPIYIYVAPLQGNQGRAQIKFTSPDNIQIDAIKGMDTSLLMKLVDVGIDAPTLEESEVPVQNLFATSIPNNQIEVSTSANPEENVIAKITSGSAHRYAEAQNMIREAQNTLASIDAEIKQEEQAPQPPKRTFDDPPETTTSARKKVIIRNYDDLIEIIQCIKGADKDLPEFDESKKRDRNYCMSHERKMSQCVKLPFPLYVKNKKPNKLEILDLGTMLDGEEVFDLSVVPARKLLASRDLRVCMDYGYIAFATRDEFKQWRVKYAEKINDIREDATKGSGLKVYDKPEQAEDDMYRGGNNEADDGPSHFITNPHAKKQPLQQQIRQQSSTSPSASPTKGSEIEITMGAQPDVDVRDEDWVDPELKQLVGSMPTERDPNAPVIQTTIIPPSKTQKKIARLD